MVLDFLTSDLAEGDFIGGKVGVCSIELCFVLAKVPPRRRLPIPFSPHLYRFVYLKSNLLREHGTMHL